MLAEAVQNLSRIEHRKGGLRVFLMFFGRWIPCKNTKILFRWKCTVLEVSVIGFLTEGD